MTAIRIALAATLLTACGSSRPASSSDSTAEPQTEPADAGVSLGRPSQPGDGGPPELPPTVVKGSVLESHRLTGTMRIDPDLADRTQLAGRTSATAAVKLCVDVAGKVSSVKILRSSGLPNYDAKIEREIKSWTFRPVMGDGQAVDVCTVMTFIYRPGPPPAQP